MRAAVVLVIASALLMSCSGGGSESLSGGSDSSGPVTLALGAGTNPAGIPPATARFTVVSNSDPTVSVYVNNASSGQLLPNGYSLIKASAGSTPGQVAIHPTGQFVYVPSQDDDNVLAFTISSKGSLVEISGSPFPAGANPAASALDPTGRFLYVANALGNSISGYQIAPSTGALTPIGSVTPTENTPFALVIEPSGRFLYAANSGSNSVSAFAINASTGGLTLVSGSPFAAGGFPIGMSTDPKGRALFVANLLSSTVTAYAINATSGQLFGASTIIAGANPTDVQTDLSGQFLYVSNFGSDDVSAFSIDQATGLATEIAGSPFPTEVSPVDVQLDPNGQFLHVVNADSNSVSVFSINQATGNLTTAGATRTRTAPTALAISAGAAPATFKPAFLYTLFGSSPSDVLSSYSVNQSSGALTAVPGAPYALGTSATSLAIHPDNQFVYVAKPGGQPGENTIAAYHVDSISGALTPVSGSPFPAGTNPYQIVIEPSGRFLYVLSGAAKVSAFSIDRQTGALVALPASHYSIPTLTANVIAAEPTGRFLYVGSPWGIVVYQINAATGELTQGDTATGFLDPSRIVFDSSGRFGYTTTCCAGNQVSAFAVDPISGIPRRTFPFFGDVPGSLAQTLDLLGNFLYATADNNGVAPFPFLGYRVDRSTSQLTVLASSPFTTSLPLANLIIDPSSKFLYAVQHGAPSTLLLYSIDAASGALTDIGPVATGNFGVPIAISRVLQ